ncbi:hypothetical protein NLI96_g10333 [Meripilus lineatus]|uniref:Uncharacterized protein n=1 Tax=Meripilus lineatus TaxID=2056292 RepID=A0AAD5UTU8_9APHY|nr:hypothetical protein NLI96_g10333 [Physisporinus lineatus]
MHIKSEDSTGTSDEKRPRSLYDEMAAVGVDLEQVRYGSDDADALDVERILTGTSIPRKKRPLRHDHELAGKWGIPNLPEQPTCCTTRGSYSQAVKGVGEGSKKGKNVPAMIQECAEDAALSDERPTSSAAPSSTSAGSGNVARDFPESEEDFYDSEEEDQWSRPKKTAIPVEEKVAALQNAAKYFPDWFGIKEEEEVEGVPETSKWKVESWIPTLPNFDPVDYSLFKQYITLLKQRKFEIFETLPGNGTESEEEAEMLREAMEESKKTYLKEQEGKSGPSKAGPSKIPHISCGAMITEVKEEAKTKDESVSQHIPPIASSSTKPKKGKLTAKDKGKGVDRTKEQREFLKNFAQGTSTMSKKDEKTPHKGDSSSKKEKPPPRKPAAAFIREKSQMPDGGYLRQATKKRYEEPSESESDYSLPYPNSPRISKRVFYWIRLKQTGSHWITSSVRSSEIQ